MKTREGTWDALIETSVRKNNEYNLPDHMNNCVVVDIGAHIGSFSLACLERGAAAVIAVEPDPENFRLLVENLATESDRDELLDRCDNEKLDSGQALVLQSGAVTMFRAAIMGQSSLGYGVRRLRNHDFGQLKNTGHNDMFGDADGTVAIGIGELLDSVRGPEKNVPIDLLKIDAECAEWDIFEHGSFEGVKNIVAELHAIPDNSHPALYRLYGLSIRDLATATTERLERQGFQANFTLQLQRTGDGDGTLELGTLIARRPSAEKSKVEVRDKPTLLWIGDCLVPTGFARVTRSVCTRLQKLGWNLAVLGIGYNGDPHAETFNVFPAGAYNDQTGTSRLPDIAKRIRPDVIVCHHDSWNVAFAIERAILNGVAAPFVGYIAVDSENVRDDMATALRSLKLAICHTQFGVDQLRLAGYANKAAVIGHGVDTDWFRPADKQDSRQFGGLGEALPKNAFLWGCVNANNPRKRLDLTIAYFAEWWKRAGKPKDAYLYIHADKHPQTTWDLGQIGQYCGVHQRIIRSAVGLELTEEQMPLLYSFFDVQISTAEGESWGLTTLEGMACGIPQIAVECGGMPEWAGDSVHWVKPSVYVFSPNSSNSKRWIAAEDDFVKAMDDLYRSKELREEYRQKGFATAQAYSWDAVAQAFDRELRGVVERNQRKIPTAVATEAVLKEF